MNVIDEINYLKRRVMQLEQTLGIEPPPPPGNTLNFMIEGKNFLTVTPEGDVLIRGRKVGKDTEILKGLQEFIKAMQADRAATKILQNVPSKGDA